MSGGDSKPDPYNQKDPPKRSKAKDEEQLPKSYRGAVKPKRIEIQPNGRKKFVYDCEHCGKEGKWDARKTAKHAFCDRKCSHEWQKYGRKPVIHSPEHSKAQSKRMKDLWADPEFRANQTKAIQEVMQTPAYKERHRKAAKEVASRPEWKEKQSKAHKGKKRPPEVGRKISEAKMGHTVSDETREKLAEANSGEKCFFWKGGISGEKSKFYASWEWGKQKERTKARDDYTCLGCGWNEEELEEIGQKLNSHHVIPLEEYEGDWKSYPDDKIATVCDTCHGVSEYQDGDEKWPVNGRGEDARLDRLSNPKSQQTTLDEF
ncbi:MAG: NUMOD3 domain-containing DNA-binding protein [Candidatus Thorarchaeota archaeon]